MTKHISRDSKEMAKIVEKQQNNLNFSIRKNLGLSPVRVKTKTIKCDADIQYRLIKSLWQPQILEVITLT
jgi:hypothetical protein